MRFILTCTLGKDVDGKRRVLRARHLEYIVANRATIVFGGPSLDSYGVPESMTLVVEAEDLAAAERFIHAEPYTANGVFSNVRISRWAQVLPESHPGALVEEIAREQSKEEASVKSYVLVHGAWMGAWAWDEVATGLRKRGDDVVAVELPGHGADTTPLAEVHLAAYVAKVSAAVLASSAPVVLVGHSMSGMVVTQVAEDHPQSIAKLVYLAAYLPKDGQKLLDLALTDADSRVGAHTKILETEGIADLPRESLEDDFLADGSPEALAKLHASYRPEPLAGFVAAVKTTPDRWGRVPKVYVYTTQDRAVSHALQKRMTDGVAFVSTATLDTSHAPFLSKPDLVVSTLASL